MKETHITGKAKIAGVIGWPVAHSLSPLLHNHWLSAYDIDGLYVPLAVAPEKIEAALDGLRAMNFAGVNVTVPHKEAVIPFLDGMSEKAKEIGAVNLIINKEGKLWGDNTDGDGFIADVFNVEITPKRALILGAGGSSKAVLHALLSHCALDHISISNRTVERAQDLVHWAGDVFHMKHLDVIALPYVDKHISSYDLIINTTSLGLKAEDGHHWPPEPWTFKASPPKTLVYDLIYNPEETPLLQKARESGLQARNGLGMLIEQARPAFAAWFGVVPDVHQDLYLKLHAALKTP